MNTFLEAQTRPVVEAMTAAGVVVLTTAGVGVSVTSIIVASVATSLRRVCEKEIGLGRQTIHAGAKLTLLFVPVLVTCFPPPGIFLRVDFSALKKGRSLTEELNGGARFYTLLCSLLRFGFVRLESQNSSVPISQWSVLRSSFNGHHAPLDTNSDSLNRAGLRWEVKSCMFWILLPIYESILTF